jgi:hypothetical protein
MLFPLSFGEPVEYRQRRRGPCLRSYSLAGNAIETPRLLLNSTSNILKDEMANYQTEARGPGLQHQAIDRVAYS